MMQNMSLFAKQNNLLFSSISLLIVMLSQNVHLLQGQATKAIIE